MRIRLVLFALLLSAHTVASDFYHPAGVSSAGVNHASVSDLDFWAVINNPAATSFLKRPQFGFNYESRFDIKELSVKSLGAIIPNKFGTLTSSFQYFGYEIYNEMRLATGYSRAFGENVGASVQFNLLANKLNPQEEMKYALTLDASIFLHLSETFHSGFYLFNLSSASFTSNDENLDIPVFYRLGFEWNISSEFDFMCEVQGKNGADPKICGGLRYEIFDDLRLSVGLGENPGSISGGVVINKWGFTSGITCAVVQQIGKIWNCSLIYGF